MVLYLQPMIDARFSTTKSALVAGVKKNLSEGMAKEPRP
jgi:hypothetical protein